MFLDGDFMILFNFLLDNFPKILSLYTIAKNQVQEVNRILDRFLTLFHK